jgi:hypothetical protein
MMIWASNKSGMHSVAKTGPTEMDIYLYKEKRWEEKVKSSSSSRLWRSY